VAGEELPEAAAAPKAQARAMVRIIAEVRTSLFVVREQRPLQRSERQRQVNSALR
jgi:hypothetical protein